MNTHKPHKQGGSFTLMLVPSNSSGKTWGFVVTKGLIWIAAAIAAVVVFIMGFLFVNVGYLNHQLSGVSADLEQNKKYKAERDSLQQEYTEQLNEYGQKADELQEQFQQLLKAKEDLFNKLSDIDYLPELDEQAFQNSTEQFIRPETFDNQSLAFAQSLLGTQFYNQLSAFEKASTEIDRAKPVMDNYPTIWPVNGYISSEFGIRSDPFGGGGSGEHAGIDITVPIGTSVKAAGGGVVTFSGVQDGYGYIVIIDHGMGIKTYYAHNSQLLVGYGQRVTRGESVALSGNSGRSTGPHVHYEVRVNDQPVNPRNFL